MRVHCAWCMKEGKDPDLGETPPYDNPSVTHGICKPHAAKLRAEIETAKAALKAQ